MSNEFNPRGVESRDYPITTSVMLIAKQIKRESMLKGFRIGMQHAADIADGMPHKGVGIKEAILNGIKEGEKILKETC